MSALIAARPSLENFCCTEGLEPEATEHKPSQWPHIDEHEGEGLPLRKLSSSTTGFLMAEVGFLLGFGALASFAFGVLG